MAQHTVKFTFRTQKKPYTDVLCMCTKKCATYYIIGAHKNFAESKRSADDNALYSSNPPPVLLGKYNRIRSFRYTLVYSRTSSS